MEPLFQAKAVTEQNTQGIILVTLRLSTIASREYEHLQQVLNVQA